MIPIKKVYKRTYNPIKNKWKTTDLDYEFELPEGTNCCVKCWDKQMKKNSAERDRIKKLVEENKNG